MLGTAVLTVLERKRHKALARARDALSKSDFVSRMVEAGVRENTAIFIWEEALRYYFEPLKPDPADHWVGTMRIDPEDLEDVTRKFWKREGWVEPTRKDPVIIPTDPTLLEYAQWLDQQRQLQK